MIVSLIELGPLIMVGICAGVGVVAWMSTLGAGRPDPAAHPRMLFDVEGIPTLREKTRREPYASMVRALEEELIGIHRRVIEDAGETVPESMTAEMVVEDILAGRFEYQDEFDQRARFLGILYGLSGDRRYAAASGRTGESIADLMWATDPQSSGLARGGLAMTLALAYDLCYEAWDEALREKISQRLYEIGSSMLESMGPHANPYLPNNWSAVRYAGLGLAGLASDHPKAQTLIEEGYAGLIRHLDVNLGENGWNPEGIGYLGYPWLFTSVFGYAAWRAGVGDLREDLGDRLRMTLWTSFAGTIPIPTRGREVGIRGDLVDDHAMWHGQTANMAFHYCPSDYLPAAKWIYDHWVGQLGAGYYGAGQGLALLGLLTYPEEIEAKNPAEVVGLTYSDRSAGVAIFRNRWQDENDIAALVNAKSRHPRGGHNGPDTNTIRITGLGSAWLVGAGRTHRPYGQTNLFAEEIPEKINPVILGSLDDLQTDPATGGGSTRSSGSTFGVEDHVRRFTVDYRDDPACSAVFINAESSRNGRRWRINTPEFNEVICDDAGFTITSPTGSFMRGHLLHPGSAEWTRGLVERGAGMSHTAFPYRGHKYANNHWLELACNGYVLIVMTLHPAGTPLSALPQISAGVDTDTMQGEIVVGEQRFLLNK